MTTTTTTNDPPSQPLKFSLGLDEFENDDDDDDDDELDFDSNPEQPRRLLQFHQQPSSSSSKTLLLAYGGDDGTISACNNPESVVSNMVVDDQNNNKNNTQKKKQKQKLLHIVQRYDEDAVRAVAISSNGKRIAVGFDNNKIRIYKFDDYEQQDGDDEPHPFVAQLKKKKSGDDDVDDSDDDDNDHDMLLSQDDLPTSDSTLDSFVGPTFDGPIRDLQFLESHEEEEEGCGGSSCYWLVVAHEGGMCIVNVESTSTLSERLLEHEVNESHNHSGIRGISINKDASLMASLSMDGRLCVWNIVFNKNGNNNKSRPTLTLFQREGMKCIPKKDSGEAHEGLTDPYDRSCRPVFYSNLLATPGQLEPVIRSFSRSSSSNNKDQNSMWSMKTIETTNIEDDGHVEPIVTIGFFNKNTMVTSGRDRRVILWTYNNENGSITPIQTIKTDSIVTDLCLFRKNFKVYAACAKGSLQVLDFSSHFSKEQATKTNTTSSTTATASDKEGANHNTNKKNSISKKTAPEDSDDDDVDFTSPNSSNNPNDDDATATATATATTTTHNRVRFLDDEAEEDDDDGKADENNANQSNTAVASDRTNDIQKDVAMDDNDDDGIAVDIDDDGLGDDDDNFGVDLPTQTMYQSRGGVPPQPAFSVSSTPLDLDRRYLCWNNIGAITILHGDRDLDYQNKVDIHFTDSAYKRPISFTDNMNFILGSLGDDGAIFASDLQDDDDDDDDDDNNSIQENLDDLHMSERTKQAVKRSHKKRKNNPSGNPTGSSIFFYRFETFGSLRDKDWHINLPDGERALGSACGKGWAAVMTSRRFLRLFSAGGNQEQLVWLNGDPVTMVGRSRFLAVFYHRASPLHDKTQQLEYILWDIASFTKLSQGAVSCMSKGASLTWAGFSNDCSLMAMDSDGMLSMLIPCGVGENDGSSATTSTWEWSPVLDTVGLRKSSDDDYWPVWVSDGKLVCVPLKGGNTYPDAGRRPVTTTLGLRIPLAKSSIAKNTMLEELSIRSNLALSQKRIVKDIESEDFEQEYVGLCAQVDKVTLKLFASTLDAGKAERALDLIDRLHLEKSYDLAMRLADRNRKLVDLIEDAKFKRFVVEDDELDDNDDTEDVESNQDSSPTGRNTAFMAKSRQISPENGLFMKKRTKMGQSSIGPISKRNRLG